jgi:hypothetical protein
MLRLYKVKEQEYKHPNQVYKVPVQSYFFNHEVMSSALKHTNRCHDEGNEVDNNSGEYVESMKPGNGKEEVGKVGRRHRTIGIGKRIVTPPGTLMM